MPFAAPASDSITDLGNAVKANADYLEGKAASFIGRLTADSGINYSSIGGLDTLNYLQWDYDQALTQLVSLRPGNVILDMAEAAAAIDRLEAAVVPVSPDFVIPTAVIPSLDAERPLLSLPTLPSTDVGTAPTDVPTIVEPAVPDAPLVVLPNVPTFEELQLPVAPSFTIPSLSLQAPVNLLSPPTSQFAFVDAQYTSDLRDPLVAKLLYDLENGGYGIDTNDEAALWTRARDRAEQAARTAIDDAQRRAAQLSFPMPQGALFADMDRARHSYLGAISDANMEIALKRADMFVANRRFTIEQVQQYEKIDRDLFNAIQERAFNVSRAAVELGIAVFDASVRNFQTLLDAYKTEAAVFEIRVRAELSKAELFKSQIEAENLRGQFNQHKINLYQAQINGINATVQLYKTRVEATSVLSQIQTQKLELFRTRVQSYAELVRAKAAEYDMYKAATQGELAKVEIYKADLSAYESKLRGEEIRTRVINQSNEALNVRFNSATASYRTQVDGLAKAIEGHQAQNRQLLESLAVNVNSYRALSDAVLAGVNVRKDAQRMNNEWNIAAVNSRVEDTKFRLQEYMATYEHRKDVDKYGSKFYGDQSTAVLASLSSLTAKSE
jgi:hypothetical protein